MKALAGSGGLRDKGMEQRSELEMRTARRIELSGQVQGVGFRPFVYRIAEGFDLKGWVRNGAGRVFIHVEGKRAAVAAFERAVIEEAPPLARPRIEKAMDAACEAPEGFRILESESGERADIHLPADLFCCEDCLRELRSEVERRFRYPFTNCTQCGPRYTIIKTLPYDRANTSMAGFALCARCRAEYENPHDRRFHAEPIACPDCGPQLTFLRSGEAERTGAAALEAAAALLKAGGIVAAKGVGGYHLLCDPCNDGAVKRLRARKHRPDKPLAVMIPQAGVDHLDEVRRHAWLSDEEASALRDPARPIVLVRRREANRFGPDIAPGLREIGVFLPYSPLHHLILEAFGGSLIATSGNISGEPVITDNDEADRRLSRIADAFLHHDRPIVRPADDSVLRVIAGKARRIRIGRGLSPLEIALVGEFTEPTLAVGGHMKGAIALGWGRRIVVSPHIGELDSPRSLHVFEQVIADLSALYRVDARRMVCDAHPGYASTRWAKASGLPVVPVQHHVAHASTVAGEHPEVGRWLVFAWDGIGLGNDSEAWGGEAFVGWPGAWRRAASMRPFRLPGGDAAGREPWRSAAALMWEAGRSYAPRIEDAHLAAQAWKKEVNTAVSSSVGRLFDAAASLVLAVDVASFEGQGPMLLEASAVDATGEALPLSRDANGLWRADWEPLLAILTDASISAEERAGVFHDTMARTLVAQALAILPEAGFEAVGLCGGVFQNKRLSERIMVLLAGHGIAVYLPETVPANDGGLAFGQLVEVLGKDN
jgi:hydrogenase maturation protein HypF